jgi:hypothetical protein
MGAAGEQSSLLFRNSATSTTLLTLDTTGNLGLGGVNPNVWSSRYKTIQGGSNGGSSMFFDYQDYSTRFFSNAIIDSANITRFVVSTTGATGYSLNRVGHEWHCAGPATANAEITGFATPKMTLDLSGNLGLGVTPSAWYTTTATTALQLPIAMHMVLATFTCLQICS